MKQHTTLFRTFTLTADQMAVVKKFIKWNKGSALFRNKQLHEAAKATIDHEYCPYFIGKNTAVKVNNRPGWYDLSKLRLSKQLAVTAKSVKIMEKRGDREKKQRKTANAAA